MSLMPRALFVLAFVLSILFKPTQARAASDSLGVEFWLTFPGNAFCCGTPTLTLFITGPVATTGTVSGPGIGSTINFTVTPGTVTTVPIPLTAHLTTFDGVQAKGFRVQAGAEITVYGLNRIPATTDAYLGLPTDILGTEYIVLGYKNSNVVNATEFAVVAPQDGTVLTITPSVTTGPHPAGTAYNVTLNQGDAYQLINTNAAPADLSGTIVTATKPVAVFGGHNCANIPPGFFACDHVVEQLTPPTAWGKTFATMPLATRLNGDTFRFLASTNNTQVFVNGALVATLNRGQVHERIIAGPAHIISTQPILVAQYSNSSSFDGVTSDPFMMLIPPYEQFLASYTITTPASGFAPNFVNVVAPTATAGLVTLDGTPIPITAFTPIGLSGFSGAQRPISLGAHNLAGPLPFGVFVYGFASFDSYGYPGGMSLAPVATVTTVTLAPKTATNPVNTQHCVTATVTDQNGQPVAGVRVDFNVTGANPTVGFTNTAADGTAPFCYTGANQGTDAIKASVGTVFDVAAKIWEPVSVIGPPAFLVLEPKAATNPVGTEHCVTATVTDATAHPTPDITVIFSVSGANAPADSSAPTDSSGQASSCYTGTVSGTDTVNAFADSNKNGTKDAGEPFDTATKTWTAGSPATLVLSPKTDTNVVGNQHCETATVKDSFGNPTPGITVDFSVSGVNSPPSTSAPTDNSGQASSCYTGTVTGTDTINAFADTNKNGTKDTGEPSDTATKTWTAGPPATLTLAPKTDTNVVGNQHCETATVKDSFANPTPGVTVSFSVSGANPQPASSAPTDGSGQASSCYTGTVTGTDTISAFADTNKNGTRDPGEPSDTATKTWTAGAPATLTLTPPSDTNVVDSQHCVTATVADSFHNPTPGITVRFSVSGSVTTSGTGSSPTNASGQATFCYMGPALPGSDVITAFADTNNNGVQDPGEPSGRATKVWVLPQSTVGCKVTGGGRITATNGDKATFGGNAVFASGTASGSEEYQDHGPAADLNVHSTVVLVVVCSGNTASVFGTATIDGSGSFDYRIDLTDNGEPGADTDKYRIRLSTGYDSGEQTLSGGNIQLHQ